MEERHYKILEWIQLLYKQGLVDDEQTQKDNIALTMQFPVDLKTIAANIPKA